MLEKVCPVLPSRDFDVTANFYGRMGFEVGYRNDGYLVLARDGSELHFFRHPDHDPDTSDHGAYLKPHDAASFSAALEKLDIPNIEGQAPRFIPAEDKPWGMHEGAIVDPDGSLLRFGHELKRTTV
ncbi:MAG: VOC family protein [Pseudomonadota bacterium]